MQLDALLRIHKIKRDFSHELWLAGDCDEESERVRGEDFAHVLNLVNGQRAQPGQSRIM